MTAPNPIDAAVDFVFANRHRIADAGLQACDRETARQAFTFHALHNTLRLEWNGRAIVGIGIAWRDDAERIRAADAKGEEIFHWAPSDPHGDCLYLGLFIATAPGVAYRLARFFRQRFPNLPEYAHRRGRLVCRHWLNTYTQGN